MFVIFLYCLVTYISIESVTKCCERLQYSWGVVKFCASSYLEFAPS